MSDTDTIEAARSNHLEVLRDVIDLNARITRATGIIIEPRKPEAVDMTEACNQLRRGCGEARAPGPRAARLDLPTLGSEVGTTAGRSTSRPARCSARVLQPPSLTYLIREGH